MDLRLTGAVLIVSRNNLRLTREAVRTALGQDSPVQVLLIDNASTDGTLGWMGARIRTNFQAIHFNPQKSLAACWNRGIRAFLHAGYDRVLVVNNDVELRADTHRILSWVMDETGAGVTSAVSVDDPVELVLPRSLPQLKQSVTPHPNFSCFMLHRTVIERAGWFDESYFPAYCEDSDYHVRLYRAGIGAVSVGLPVLHLGAGTLRHAARGEKRRIEAGAERNREKFRQAYGCLPGTPEYEDLFKPPAAACSS